MGQSVLFSRLENYERSRTQTTYISFLTAGELLLVMRTMQPVFFTKVVKEHRDRNGTILNLYTNSRAEYHYFKTLIVDQKTVPNIPFDSIVCV